MHITFEFATQDDCLDKMVPSDLRQLVEDRDRALEQVAALAATVQALEVALKEVIAKGVKVSNTCHNLAYSSRNTESILESIDSLKSAAAAAEKLAKETPKQHLSEVKAQAVRDFVYWGTVKLDPEFAEFKDCAETFISIGCPSLPREVLSD